MPVSPPPHTLLTPPELHPDMELVMRVMPMPKDANGNGDIFGGWIMSQVDLAGCVLPGRVSRGRVTTVAVNEFIFRNAVSVGDLLSFYAKVTRVGRTSITVHVEVVAERHGAVDGAFDVEFLVAAHGALDGQPGSHEGDFRFRHGGSV